MNIHMYNERRQVQTNVTDGDKVANSNKKYAVQTVINASEMELSAIKRVAAKYNVTIGALIRDAVFEKYGRDIRREVRFLVADQDRNGVQENADDDEDSREAVA